MTKFESKECPRCGGSGHYSFNLMHGTMCYGCSGTGEQLTKRGKAAKDFFAASMQIPASELKVGMAILESSGYKTFAKIEGIWFGTSEELGKEHGIARYEGEYAKREMVVIKTHRTTLVAFPNSMFRVIQSDADKKAKFQAALAYQATLNANGTVAKRKVAKKA